MRRILGIDPCRYGCGIAIIEDDPLFLVNWQVIDCGRRKPAELARRIERIVADYKPSIIVMQKCAGEQSKYCRGFLPIVQRLTKIARSHKATMKFIERNEIREFFLQQGARTKDQIAELIAKQFPELAWKLPKPRTVADEENYAMGIFDAVALGLALVEFRDKKGSW